MFRIYVTENEVCSRHDHMAKGREKTVKLVILAAIFLTFGRNWPGKNVFNAFFI